MESYTDTSTQPFMEQASVPPKYATTPQPKGKLATFIKNHGVKTASISIVVVILLSIGTIFWVMAQTPRRDTGYKGNTPTPTPTSSVTPTPTPSSTPTPTPTPSPTVQPTSEVSNSNRVTVTGTGSYPQFSVELPRGWEWEKLQGIDTLVGKLTNGQIEVYYDYGNLATQDYPHNPEYTTEEILVDGQTALIVRPVSEDSQLTIGAYYQSQDDHYPPLNITTTSQLNQQQLKVVEGILTSVKFTID